MNANELREVQAPLKARYREQPEAGVVTLRATGRVSPDSLTCKVETGKAMVEAGLHPATGGAGVFACSGDMLLEALAACAGVTLSAVATALAVNIREGSVLVEGDLDFRGTLGVAKDVPVGFRDIRLRFQLDTDATPEQLAKVIALTERYCVVFQTLSRSPTMTVSY
ncbi:MAG: OsmC family protein [Acidobacteriota bacterium]